MLPENTNIQDFIQDLCRQAQDSFSSDIPDTVKDFIVDIIREFMGIAGDILKNDKENKYTLQQTEIICQILGEWLFHKGIDNYKNEIPKEYWRSMLQEIAFVVYNTAKLYILSEKELEVLLNNVEEAVNATYEKLITKLEADGILKKSKKEILKQSNLENYVCINNRNYRYVLEQNSKKKIKFLVIIGIYTILWIFLFSITLFNHSNFILFSIFNLSIIIFILSKFYSSL